MASKYDRRVDEMTDNLIRLYNGRLPVDDTNGRQWYDKAGAIMREWSESYRLPLVTVASVTAAISPQCDWERNLIIADEVLAGHNAPSIGGALPANIRKAVAIRDGASLFDVFISAPKVASFAVNLAGDYSAVTVDTHAVQAAFNDVTVNVSLKANVYESFAEAYRRAATAVGERPAIFQAIIWSMWKRLHPRLQKRSERMGYANV